VSRYERRIEDYRRFGVPYIWVIDPQHRGAFECSSEAWRPVEVFTIANPPLTLPLGALW